MPSTSSLATSIAGAADPPSPAECLAVATPLGAATVVAVLTARGLRMTLATLSLPAVTR
jgi:hypothetical protein